MRRKKMPRRSSWLVIFRLSRCRVTRNKTLHKDSSLRKGKLNPVLIALTTSCKNQPLYADLVRTRTSFQIFLSASSWHFSFRVTSVHAWGILQVVVCHLVLSLLMPSWNLRDIRNEIGPQSNKTTKLFLSFNLPASFQINNSREIPSLYVQ